MLLLLALTPLNVLALWAAELDEVRLSAGVSLAAIATQLLGVQQSQRASRAFI